MLEREREVERMRLALERNEYPRLRMLLIVALTGGCGFLASVVMLHHGVESIALRYPLALCAAYAAFLLLLWAWLRSRPRDYFDAPDIGDLGSGWRYPQHSGDGPNGIDPLSGVDVGDEFAIPLLLIVFVAIVVCASAWIVYMAPALFAELLFDGILATGLYRRLRRSDRRHWLDTALRRTWPAFALTLVALIVFGLGVQHYRPHAKSIGDVLRPSVMASDSSVDP
ncbi:MAG: hypothetical protein ABI843_05285 [Dokdonella sp.]